MRDTLRRAGTVVNTVFGEAVTYRRASGDEVELRAMVSRTPPIVDDVGATRGGTLVGSIYIRREDIDEVAVGEDEVVVTWTDGQQKTARIVQMIDHSDALWHVGITL